MIATLSGGLAHGDRLWGDPNSLSHGTLVMGDSSGPQGESCLCGAGSGLMSPRGYWGSLSCHGASRLTVCCRWEDSSDGMGKWGRRRFGSSLQIDDPCAPLGACKAFFYHNNLTPGSQTEQVQWSSFSLMFLDINSSISQLDWKIKLIMRVCRVTLYFHPVTVK